MPTVSLPPDLPPRLRARQLAEIYSVHPKTIYKWAREGVLPRPARVGRRILLWTRESIRAHLAGLQGGGADA
jgi:predicted DNA-binding transcriptional regulator AlpA